MMEEWNVGMQIKSGKQGKCFDRIYRIYQIFSQFPDETEKG